MSKDPRDDYFAWGRCGSTTCTRGHFFRGFNGIDHNTVDIKCYGPVEEVKVGRHRFAREGVETVLDRTIEVGAIQWGEDEVLPVVWMNDFANLGNLMGSASDFQREEDGWLTAEILWTPRHREFVETDLDKSFFLTIYANELVVKRRRGESEIVKSCKLKSIFGTINDPWAVKDG